MLKTFSKLYKGFLILLSLPIILSDYFCKTVGRDYNVGFFIKIALVFKMIRNNIKIISASDFLEHLIMAKTILKIPKYLEGVVIECGSYKGGSTANLSLVCALCNRKFEVFDSFEGLPEPSKHDKEHAVINVKELHTYSKGAWRGGLQEVKENISRYGKINVCNFHVGYFNEILPKFKKKSAFIFLDVDLRDSLEACIKYLWPLLQDGCSLFTHEASHMKIASLFFDKDWWNKNINSEPPGLVGAGSGLGLFPASGGFRSSLGYSIKNPRVSNFKELPQTG